MLRELKHEIFGEAVAMPTYGDPADPDDLGSGGVGSSLGCPGGAGGGLVRITAGSIVLNGQVNANSPGACFGDGAGGGIKLVTSGALTGTGACFDWFRKPTVFDSLIYSILFWPCIHRWSSPFRFKLPPFTRLCCRASRLDSCSPMIPVLERPSWPGC